MPHRPKVDNAAMPERSKQNLSCNWTGSADFGRLVPIHWEELVEGDHVITCKPRIEMQMLAFASPTFGKIDLYCHYFVVPIRQLQKNFYDIWSQTGSYKSDVLSHFTPKSLASLYQQSQTDAMQRGLFKHWTSLGLNPFFTLGATNVADNTTPISYFPFAAYNKIWWDFYRDPEVLRDESINSYLYTDTIVGTPDDQNFANAYLYPHVRSIKNCWLSDLFASSGQDSNYSPSLGIDPYSVYKWGQEFKSYKNQQGETIMFETNENGTPSAGDWDADNVNVQLLSNASSNIRLIEALTRLAERLSLSGKRQIEALYARYGVKPKWSEMNLCRYVGGAKSTVLVDSIISNADTVAADGVGSPLGAKGGTGYCALNDLNIQVSVDEPSILMGIVSVMPHIHFVQGLSKKWQRKELTDLFQSDLQYVGNIGVAKREVAMKYRSNQTYDSTKDGLVFAYSDPYYEYKMGLDTLAGDFMTYHNVTLPTDPQAKKDLLYMQSMEQYIDFPFDRNFNLNNMLIDGDQYNKIFAYLGGSIFDDVDDHFFLCIDKEVIVDRPMAGFAIPTLETTKDPHERTAALGHDTIL